MDMYTLVYIYIYFFFFHTGIFKMDNQQGTTDSTGTSA